MLYAGFWLFGTDDFFVGLYQLTLFLIFLYWLLHFGHWMLQIFIITNSAAVIWWEDTRSRGSSWDCNTTFQATSKGTRNQYKVLPPYLHGQEGWSTGILYFFCIQVKYWFSSTDLKFHAISLKLDKNERLLDFVHKLEAGCIETVEAGKMTKDLAILIHGPNYVSLSPFGSRKTTYRKMFFGKWLTEKYFTNLKSVRHFTEKWLDFPLTTYFPWNKHPKIQKTFSCKSFSVKQVDVSCCELYPLSVIFHRMILP